MKSRKLAITPCIDSTVTDEFRDTMKHNLNHDKLIIVLIYDKSIDAVRVSERWTNLSTEVLRMNGFKRGYGFKDKLAYSGVKVYVKKIGFKVATPLDNETAESQRNFLESNASAEFKKGFAKTSMGTLEKKQLLTIIPIAIGIVLGVYFLMGGF